MTVIKNLAFCNKNKLKSLTSFVESELDLSVFYPFPLDLLHSFLPFGLKFLNESFAAIENKKIKGLVTVQKTGRKKIKFIRLLFEENSMEEGKLLINFVITQFLSKGVESFIVTVDKRNAPVLNVFKTGSGFSALACESVYKTDKNDIIIGYDEVNFEYIRKIRPDEINKTLNFINGMMNSYQKVTFKKEAEDFKNLFLNSAECYVVENEKENGFLGYFSILKLNRSDYILDFVIAKGYEGYFSDIVKFAKTRVSKRKNFNSLLIRLKSYYSNYGELNEMLSLEYENRIENEILVKDFLIPKKQFSYEKMVFNDVTPAF